MAEMDGVRIHCFCLYSLLSDIVIYLLCWRPSVIMYCIAILRKRMLSFDSPWIISSSTFSDSGAHVYINQPTDLLVCWGALCLKS